MSGCFGNGFFDRSMENELFRYLDQKGEPCEDCENNNLSDCCNAPVIWGDICRDCGEHCGTMCDDCEYKD